MLTNNSAKESLIFHDTVPLQKRPKNAVKGDKFIYNLRFEDCLAYFTCSAESYVRTDGTCSH